MNAQTYVEFEEKLNMKYYYIKFRDLAKRHIGM
jgi:hypothetical protein